MSRQRQLRYHPDAADEAEAALDWYLERSPRAAVAFVLEPEHAAVQILESPSRWPMFGTQFRRYLLPTFPFSVIYWIRDFGVEVVAVAHHRRRPGYWKTRTR